MCLADAVAIMADSTYQQRGFNILDQSIYIIVRDIAIFWLIVTWCPKKDKFYIELNKQALL